MRRPFSGLLRLKTRLLDRMRASLEFQVGLDFGMIDAQAHRPHRLPDLDRYRTDFGIEAIGAEPARRAHAMLHPAEITLKAASMIPTLG